MFFKRIALLKIMKFFIDGPHYKRFSFKFYENVDLKSDIIYCISILTKCETYVLYNLIFGKSFIQLCHYCK